VRVHYDEHERFPSVKRIDKFSPGKRTEAKEEAAARRERTQESSREELATR
jgi:hypothetical protein